MDFIREAEIERRSIEISGNHKESVLISELLLDCKVFIHEENNGIRIIHKVDT